MIRNGKPLFFSDKNKVNYQASVSLLAIQFKPSKPMEGPIDLYLSFFMPRPKSLMPAKYPDHFLPCVKRPDWDNLCKGTIDALSACGFWKDDSQIYKAQIIKYYAERDKSPRIDVSIREGSI